MTKSTLEKIEELGFRTHGFDLQCRSREPSWPAPWKATFRRGNKYGIGKDCVFAYGKTPAEAVDALIYQLSKEFAP